MKRGLNKLVRSLLRTMNKALLGDVYHRLGQIEYRAVNRRFYAIDQLAEFLVGADIPGDYLEFGVYKGTTFIYAYKSLSYLFGDMRFIAFDSFEGLPQPTGIDSLLGYTSNFHEAEFKCDLETFSENLKLAGIDMNRVISVKGWFDKALIPQKAKEYGVNKIAAAWIDCDLYESMVPVLKFITGHLSTGSVILFDDWRCYRNHPDFGAQRACREWLAENSGISLHELFSFGWNGLAFTVEAKD